MNISKLEINIKKQKAKCRENYINIKLNLIFDIKVLGKPVIETCKKYGTTRKTFNKWWNRYKKSGYSIKSLYNQSTRPDTSPTKTNIFIENNILNIRKEFPYMGPIRISMEYEALYNMHISPSTISNVLKRNNILREKKPKPKHTKRYEYSLPGQCIQMDVKYVPFKVENKKLYQYDIIDDCTRIKYSQIFEEHSALNSAIFLTNAYTFFMRLGIIIKKVQTDNGAEFTNTIYAYKSKTGQVREHILDKT